MPLVVVLRFGSGIRVDIVEHQEPTAAIANFAAQCLSKGAELPLIEAVTSSVSVQPGSALANALHALALGDDRAFYPAANGDDRPKPANHPLPVAGLVRAVGRYVSKAKAGTDTSPARDTLSDFFSHYDVTLNFDGEP